MNFTKQKNKIKQRLISILISRFKFSKFGAQTLVDNFFEQICVALVNGNTFKIHGFGNFRCKDIQDSLMYREKS